MVSIYDEDLTRMKNRLKIRTNDTDFTDDEDPTEYDNRFVIKPINNSDLYLLIPLFDYDTVIVNTDDYYKILDNGSIIIKGNSHMGDFEFMSDNNTVPNAFVFSIAKIDDILSIILSDLYGNRIKNVEIEAYTSTDNTEYVFDKKIQLNNHGQAYYNSEANYVKFKYDEVYSDEFEL